MSFFWGMYSRTEMPHIKERVLRAVPGDAENDSSSQIFSYDKIAAVKCDIGVYGDKGFYEKSDMGFCLVAGDPIYSDNNGKLPRSEQLKEIFNSIIIGDRSVLNSCRGQFSMVVYNKKDHVLLLIADSNGSRPLYFCNLNNCLFFGNSFDVICTMANVGGAIDWEAKVQKLTFGVPLGDRTENKKINVIRNGEMLMCDRGAVKRQQYFKWDSLPEIDVSPQKLGPEVYKVFEDSVSVRCQPSKIVPAFLSGGLDSRCLVAVLRKLGKDVKGFNFYKPGEKDQYFAEAYADAVDMSLYKIKRPEKDWSWGGLMADALRGAGIVQGNGSTGALVFSGDGGSVGLGRVYLKEDDIAVLNKSGEDALAKRFVTDKRRIPPLTYLKSHKGSEILESLIESMRKELMDIDCTDPIKKLFLFFLHNDQRRHLHHHYENILSHRIELLVPFMDKRLNEVVISAPAKLFLYHKFYHYWLNFFPDTTQGVPWQTYPGHLECPVEIKGAAGIDQWESSKHETWNVERLNEVLETLKLRLVLKQMNQGSDINRWRLLAACLAHALGLGNYSYVFRFIKTMYETGSACDARSVRK